jgi:MFS family permease
MSFRLRPLYFSEAIAGFANNLVGIFVPIFLLTVGYSLTEVFSLYLVWGAVIVASTLFAGWLSARFPLRLVMMAHIPFWLLFLGLLGAAPYYHIPAPVLGAVLGAQIGFYFLPLHTFFAMGSERGSVGKQLGMLMAFPQIVRLGAPLLGGLIAAKWGFGPVFAIAAVLFATTSIPIARMPKFHEPFSYSIKKFRRYYRHHRRYFWFQYVNTLQNEVDNVIWPLVVYLTVRNTLQAGAASTIIAAGSAIFTYVVGHQSDRRSRHNIMRLGALVMLGLWLFRLVPLTPTSVFVISALVGFSVALVQIPVQALLYNLARTNNPREFVIFREMAVSLARITFYATAMLVATNLKNLFVVAIVAYTVVALSPKFNSKRSVYTPSSNPEPV